MLIAGERERKKGVHSWKLKRI